MPLLFEAFGKFVGAHAAGFCFALALAGGFAWHENAVHQAKVAQAAADKVAIDTANTQAQAAHDAAQTSLDTTSAPANAAAQARLDAIDQNLAKLTTAVAAYKPTVYAKALPANCVFDAQRVSDANQALRQ